MAVSGLQYGKGSQLWKYWTEGEGLAKWAESPTPFRTLRALLAKYVPAPELNGLAATMFQHVFHMTPLQHARLAG